MDPVPRAQGVSVRAGVERQFLQCLNRKLLVMLIASKCPSRSVCREGRSIHF